MSCDERFEAEATALGYRFDGEIKIGGNYVPVVRDGPLIYVSGQIPRVGDTVVITGAAGAGATLEMARTAAKVCLMRALALLRTSAGALENIRAVPKINVYVQSAPGFIQQSEVADAASDLLIRVLGPLAAHTRTSVGVMQLPKNATVEIDMVVRVA